MATVVRDELWLAALLAVGIACTGCTTRTSAAPQDIPVVAASHAVRMEMRNDVTLTAELEPYYEVDVMAKEAGYIRHMLVDIGDHVKAGQLLCVIEIPELQDDLQRAKADVQTATAEQSAAESAEGDDGTKRNAELQSMVRTQGREAVSQAQDRHT